MRSSGLSLPIAGTGLPETAKKAASAWVAGEISTSHHSQSPEDMNH
jgi:hypothetical protein